MIAVVSLAARLDEQDIRRRAFAFDRALDDELEEAARDIADRICFAARADHPYQNRTGNLERSTQGDRPYGSFMNGTLEAVARATMPYATFVEDRGYEFMDPAYDRVESQLELILDQALNSAADRGDWR